MVNIRPVRRETTEYVRYPSVEAEWFVPVLLNGGSCVVWSLDRKSCCCAQELGDWTMHEEVQFERDCDDEIDDEVTHDILQKRLVSEDA